MPRLAAHSRPRSPDLGRWRVRSGGRPCAVRDLGEGRPTAARARPGLRESGHESRRANPVARHGIARPSAKPRCRAGSARGSRGQPGRRVLRRRWSRGRTSGPFRFRRSRRERPCRPWRAPSGGVNISAALSGRPAPTPSRHARIRRGQGRSRRGCRAVHGGPRIVDDVGEGRGEPGTVRAGSRVAPARPDPPPVAARADLEPLGAPGSSTIAVVFGGTTARTTIAVPRAATPPMPRRTGCVPRSRGRDPQRAGGDPQRRYPGAAGASPATVRCSQSATAPRA